MNRIYRRVWSTALQCWVVASELAARKGKAGRAASATGLTVLLSMLAPDAMATKPPGQEEAQHEQAIQEWAVRAALGLPSADIISPRRAIAPFAGPTPVSQLAFTTDTSYANSTVNGNHLVVLGSRSSLTGNFSVGYGNLITTRGDSIVAIGYNVKATNGGYNTAVGTNAIANGVGATVYGNGAQAHSENSVAMGSGAVTHDGAGIAKIAIGGDAYAGSSGWTGAIAIGGNSRAEYDGIAIGHEASTSANGTVALGRGSVASVANTVSVGNATSKRRIVNVANGDVNTTSTDAVNGRQLNAVSVDARTALGTANTAKSTADRALAATGLVTQTSASSAIRVGGANAGSVVDVANRNGGKRRIQNIDNGVLSASSTDAVTGQQLHATNQAVTTATSTATAAKTAADGAAAKATVAANTTATGTAMTSANKATATGTGALASGTSAKAQGTHATALGFSAQATANQATAVGREAVATGSYATAVGNLAKAGGGSALALGDRSSATHGNAVALGAGSVTASDNSVSVGNASGKRKIQYVGDGTIGAGSTDAVTGSQLHATNTLVGTAQSTATSAQTAAGAAQRTADALTTRATALEGLVSQTAVAGPVRIGAQNTGTTLDVRNKSNANRKISGVADATLSATSTEAVTGKQLAATNTSVTAAHSAATTAQTAATDAQRTADGVVTRATALEGLVSQVSATGNLRLGGQNTGTVLDVRNKSNAARKLSGVADGTVSATSTEAVTGKQLNVTNTNVTAAQNAAATAQTAATAAQRTADGVVGRATALEGLVSQVSASGNLRLGAQNTGTTLDLRNKSNAARKLSGVADGTLSATSADAVTGKQLFGTQQKVTANEGLLATHSSQLSGQDGRITDNRRDLDELRTEFENFDPDLDGVVKFAADGSIDMNGGRVRGLAAGDVSSAASTDAVNGGQLFATNHRVSLMESAGRFVAVDFDEESSSAKAGEFSVAIGDSAEAGEGTNGATAVGAYARARARSSVALGRAAFVDGTAENGFALGTGSTVLSKNGTALGGYSRVETGAENSVALGGDSTATEENVVSVGNLTKKRRIVNVARGRGPEDASTITQLNESLALLGGNAGVDVNGNIISPTYNLQGGTQNTVADALAVLDGAVTTTGTRVNRVEHQLRSVFQDSPATRTDGLNQLNLAGANGMVLGNVANGLIAPGSRDAVNGGQLHAMEQRLDGRIDGLEQRVDTPLQGRAMATASAPTPPVAAEEEGSGAASGTPEAASAGDGGGRIASADDGGKPSKADAPAPAPTPTPQVSTADLEKMLARANEYTDDAIKGVEQRLDKMDKRFNRLAAMNSAQSAMAMNTAGLATYNRLGAGVGYSDGESAMAVGYQRVLNEKGSATFSLNGAFTNSGEQSVGLGVGIGW